MSDYRVCKVDLERQSIEQKKFDDKEDAEHYAKNQSSADDKHTYEIQKNHHGEFSTIKSYLRGSEN